MKRSLTFGLIVLGVVLGGILGAGKADAAVADWHQGASIVPKNSTDFASAEFRQSLTNWKATGANYVSLVIPYYQSNRYSADLQPGWNTPTDSSLVSAINYAHSLGLKVNLKIHIELFEGGWRANIDPGGSDRPIWYQKYNNILVKYAKIAEANNAELYTIGTELIRMAGAPHNANNTTEWRKMIANVRAEYSGPVTYSANWGEDAFATETTKIQFWDALDYISLSAYYYLNKDDNNYSVEALKSGWTKWNTERITPLYQTWNKPILFAEIGYRSHTGSHTTPWDYERYGTYNAANQANAYEALFQYWNDFSFVKGISIWEWESSPNAGGEGNINFTPQNKPAQQIISNWFGGVTPPPTPTDPPPPTGQPTFSASGTINPAQPVVNQPINITANVKNTGGSASNVIVDVEVFNSSNQQVHQKFFEAQNFTLNQIKAYTTSFTPTSAGNYYATAGVFNSNWSTNHFWDTVKNFSVASQTTTPPPAPTPPPTLSCNSVGTNAFFGCYYDNIDLTNLKHTRTDNAISFEWGTNAPHSSIDPETFSVQWQGNFAFEAGTYNFTARSDDGIRIYVDNTLVLDKWIDQGATTYTFSRQMTAGTKLIKVLYYENTVGAVAKFSWVKATSTAPPPTPTPTPTPTPSPTPPPPPPPTSGTIEIWWPTSDANVSGVQPFQALLQGADVDSYKMYWQVDGDALNLMENDSTGYPHKRSLVDVTNWTWRGRGPYEVNFVAKNSNGAVIAQKKVLIYTN